MIQVPPQATIVVMHDAINFRAGIDGTASIARLVLEKDPMDGALFVFRNRRGHMLRVLFYDGSGFWLCTKRLSKGCFSGVAHRRRYPPLL
jgi:transposase